MADIVFNGGDEIRQPFLIEAAGTIVDLSGCTLTAEVWWRGAKRIDLTPDIFELAPEAAEDEADQTSHGMFVLTEEQTSTIPLGRIAFVRYVVVAPTGVTMSTGPTYLERRL